MELNHLIAKDEKEDIITAEQFPTSDSTHPRSIMLIRRTNRIPYPYLVTTVMDLITKGNGCDPVTRQPFSLLTRQRAELYYKSLCEFPTMKMNELNTSELYHRWINTHKSGTVITDDVRRTRLEAECFLQIEDLLGIFESFHGKGSLLNRKSAEDFLTSTNRRWVLRHCSIEDTQYDKAYGLSYRTEKDFFHMLIVHRIGEGFFYGVILARNTPVNKNLVYSRSYPTIITLLETEIPSLLRETTN